jgi:crotonobetainyl-CoA:carnitine CoA-transferase CaiB-like acyl-CoA transferase
VLNIDEDARMQTKFFTNAQRVVHREELTLILRDKIIQCDSSELMRKIHALKIPAGLVQNVKEVFEMDVAKELLINAQGLTGVRTFVGFNQKNNLTAPPHFGEHTDEILNMLKNGLL